MSWQIHQLLSFLTNAMGMLCAILALIVLVSIAGAWYILNFFNFGGDALVKRSKKSSAKVDPNVGYKKSDGGSDTYDRNDLEEQDQGEEDGNVTVRFQPH